MDNDDQFINIADSSDGNAVIAEFMAKSKAKKDAEEKEIAKVADEKTESKRKVESKRQIESKKESDVATNDAKPKKRVLFFLIGLPLGFLGLHFLYAKRYVMFGLTLATFIAIIISAAAKIGVIAVMATLMMVVLWPLFTLFGKKDGNKLRMTWF